MTSRESVLAPSWMYEGTYSLETQDRTRALLLTSGLISADGQLRPSKTLNYLGGGVSTVIDE